MKPDYKCCCEEVWSRERWSRHYQCTKPRGHGPDGAYCKQHDPKAVAARKAKSDAKGKADWRKRMIEVYGQTFFDALVKIADGYNDARGLAKEIVDNFNKSH